MPYRFCEFATGSICFFLKKNKNSELNDFISILAFIFLILVILSFTNVNFPGIKGFIVSFLTSLIIHFNSGRIFKNFCQNFMVQRIGLISYSTYLWHQPLFAFARIRSLEHPSATLMLILSAITILLAYLSWQYVEKPFRRPQFISGTRVFQASAIGLMLFIVVGTLGHFGIFRPHLSQQQQALIASFETISNARMDAIYPDVCHYTGNTRITQQEFQSQWHCSTTFANGEAYLGHVAVAGDSNAADIANGFRLNKMSVSSMSGAGCSLVPAKMTSGCLAMFTDFIEF